MTDFEDDFESFEEQLEDEQDDFAPPGMESYDDLESDQWSDRFGESYVEDPFDVEELDDQELERLEDEFFHGGSGPRSDYGQLDEIDDD